MLRFTFLVAVVMAAVQAYMPLTREEKLQVRAEAEHFTPEDVAILVDHHKTRTRGHNLTTISPYDKRALIHEYEFMLVEVKAVEASKEDLEKAVKSAISFATSKLDQLVTAAKETIKRILAATSKAMDGDSADLKKELQHLKDRAKTLYVDVKSCLKQKEDQLYAIPKTYGKKLVQCASQKVDEAKALILKVTTTVKAFLEKVASVKKEWQACGSGVSGAACKIKVGFRIAKAAITIPISIIKAACEATIMVQTIHIDLGKCATKVGHEFVTEGQGLITFMEECVVKKIPSTVPPGIY